MGVQWVVVVIMILLLMASRRDQSVILVVVSEAPPPEPPPHPLLGCKEEEDYMCGSVSIPYPFGTTRNCSRSDNFHITCNHTTNPPKPFLIDISVLAIDISSGELQVLTNVSSNCYYPNGSLNLDISFYPSIHLPTTFTVSSSRNKFTAIGCNNAAYISDEEEEIFSSGCVSMCYSINSTAAAGGNCSGLGCCQTRIPDGLSEYSIHTRSFEDLNSTIGFNPCSYAFVVEEDVFEFRPDFLRNFPEEFVPTVLEWVVDNKTCEDAIKEPQSYGCKADNSTCSYSDINGGYRCNCEPGFTGNPYLTNGCQDVDECTLGLHNCKQICNNLIGNYSCSCDKGYRKDEANQGNCIPLEDDEKVLIVKVVAGICSSIGVLVLLFGLWWLWKILKRRKKNKLKQKFFKRNGGLLLQQQLSSGEGSVEKTKVFTSKELKKATDNYNQNRILGQGGQGTVFKGMLTDGRVVAIKKSRIMDEGQLEQFINEVVILSQINHRNIVKIFGCCLETEVPLLVYEFIPNGTLFQYIHEENEELPVPWNKRVQIAAEVASALFYLHSTASIPIYHRDIKSSNILLDEKYRAKVADFGTSRSLAIDQTHLTTRVMGTFGYLDPEYFQSSQFTEKSDVYSFGVVLVELLTGQKAISSTVLEEGISLATHFILTMKENKLYDIIDAHVLKEGGKHEIIVVANLAKRCLNLSGRKRPTMREVAIVLEGIRISQGASITQQNYEEVEYEEDELNGPWDVTSTSTGSYMDTRGSLSIDVQPLLFK